MQEKSHFVLNTEKITTTISSTPKCKTSPNCDDLSTVKKQLIHKTNKTPSSSSTTPSITPSSKLNAIIDSITFQNSPNSNDRQYVDQENRAPTPSEMSSCDSEELCAATEMVETRGGMESDDCASDAGAIVVGNFWSNNGGNNNKTTTSNGNNKRKQNKRKQSRPQRCSTYLRDRNNSLDSAIDLGGDHTSKDSDDDDDDDDDEYSLVAPNAQNGCHVMEVGTTNGNGIVTDEENGNDYKYVVRSQTGLPCVFTIQPNQALSDVDSPNHSDLDSYVITENDLSERENGTPLSVSEAERDSDAEASTVAEALMDNVINIEPMNTESAAAAAQKEQVSITLRYILFCI